MSSEIFFGKTSHGKIHVAVTPYRTACKRFLSIPMEDLGQRVETPYLYWQEAVICFDCRKKVDIELRHPAPY